MLKYIYYHLYLSSFCKKLQTILICATKSLNSHTKAAIMTSCLNRFCHCEYQQFNIVHYIMSSLLPTKLGTLMVRPTSLSQKSEVLTRAGMIRVANVFSFSVTLYHLWRAAVNYHFSQSLSLACSTVKLL